MLWSEFLHCVKSVQIRSFFWSVFSRTRIEYGDLRSKFAEIGDIDFTVISSPVLLIKLLMTFLAQKPDETHVLLFSSSNGDWKFLKITFFSLRVGKNKFFLYCFVAGT